MAGKCGSFLITKTAHAKSTDPRVLISEIPDQNAGIYLVLMRFHISNTHSRLLFDTQSLYSLALIHYTAIIDVPIYSDANIRTDTLLQSYKNPLFQQYRVNQPFNKNLLRPCPVLDNPGRLTVMVEKSGAKSTDIMAPETASEYCGKCVDAAKAWAPVAAELWHASGKDAPVEDKN